MDSGKDAVPQLTARLSAAAIAGGAAAGLVSSDVDISTAASRRECANAGGLCFGIAPVVGVVVGLLAVSLLIWACFAVGGIRPLVITIPAGIVLLVAATYAYLASVPGGRLHPAWAYSLATALTFAVLALAAGPPWRPAVAVTLAVALIAAITSRAVIHDRIQADAARRALGGLQVPLLAPDLPGYHIASAYADGGTLMLDIAADNGPAAKIGAREFQILIVPVPVGFDPPGSCLAVQPDPAILAGDGPAPCLPAGRNRWLRRGGAVVQLIERRGSALVEASGSAADIGLPTLERAFDALRPSTAAELAATSESQASRR